MFGTLYWQPKEFKEFVELNRDTRIKPCWLVRISSISPHGYCMLPHGELAHHLLKKRVKFHHTTFRLFQNPHAPQSMGHHQDNQRPGQQKIAQSNTGV